MILAHVKAYDQVNETEVTIYCSDNGFTSGTSAVDLLLVLGTSFTIPADTTYLARITNGLRVDRNLFQGDQIGGSSVPSFGDLRLVNADGELDYLRNYTFDGREVKIVYLEDDLSSGRLIFSGVCRDALLNEDVLTVRLLDEKALLEQKLSPLHLPFDRAYQFTGAVDDVVTIPAGASLQDENAWTVEMWVRPDIANNGCCFGMGDYTSGYWPDKTAIHPAYNPSYSGAPVIVYDTDVIPASPGSFHLFDGEPHHLAMVYDGSDILFYVDGELWHTEANTTGAPSATGTQAVTLGCAYVSSSYVSYYTGLMWDVRGWKTARSAEEIRRDKDARLSGLEEGLHFWFPLDEAPEGFQQKQVFDYGPNGYHGVVYGSVAPYVAAFGSPQLEGQRQPLAVGRVFNAQPDLLDPRAQLYRASSDPVGSLVLKYGGEVMRGQVAANYNGTTSYSTIAAGSNYNFPSTWEISFNVDDVSGTQRILTYVNGTVSVSLYLNGSSLVLAATDSAGTARVLTSAATITPLVNYRATVVLGSGYAALYLNGELHESRTGFTGNFNPGTSTIYLGRNTSAADYFDGRLWDLRVHSGDFPSEDRDEWKDQLYHEPPDFSDGARLLGWWRLDDLDTTARDWHPTGNSGTHTNVAWPPTFTAGDAEWEDLYDGRFRVNGSVERPLTCDYRYWNPVGRGTYNRQQGVLYWAHSTDFEPGTGSFTCEFWIRNDELLTGSATAFPISKKTVASGTVAGAEGAWHIRTTFGDFLQLILTTNSTTPTCTHPTYKPISTHLGEWHHVAFVWDATTRFMSYYLDGEFAGNQDLTGISAGYNFTNAGHTFQLFSRTSTSSNPFIGALAEVRLWKEARTAQEIRDNYLRRGSDLMADRDAVNLSFYWRGDEDIATTNYNNAASTYHRGVSVSAGTAATKVNAASFRLTPGPSFETVGEVFDTLTARYSDLATINSDDYDYDEESAVCGWFFKDGTLRDAFDAFVRPSGAWICSDGVIEPKLVVAPDVAAVPVFVGSDNCTVASFTAIEKITPLIWEFRVRRDSGKTLGYALKKTDQIEVMVLPSDEPNGAGDALFVRLQVDGTNQIEFMPWQVGGEGLARIRPGGDERHIVVAYTDVSYPAAGWGSLGQPQVTVYVDGEPYTLKYGTASRPALYTANTPVLTNDLVIGEDLDGSVRAVRVWDTTDATSVVAHRNHEYVEELSPELAGALVFDLPMSHAYGSDWRGTATALVGNDGEYSGGPSFAWRGHYDDPVHRVPAAIYSNADEVTINRLGSLLPVTEQQVRYLKNFSRVPRDQTLPSVLTNPETVRLLDSDGPTARRASNIAQTRHLRPKEDNPIVESPYHSREDAVRGSVIRVANYGVQRERYRVQVYDEDFSLQVGDEVRLIDTRFDLPALGKNFLVLAIQEEPDRNLYTIEVWG